MLYDGECIDLTDDGEPPINNGDNVMLLLDSHKPVEELTATVNEKIKHLSKQQVNAAPVINNTTPNKIQQSPATPPLKLTNINSNNNIVVLSNRVISPEKKVDHDRFVYVRPMGTSYQESNIEAGDIVLTPSPKEIRSKKFPTEPRKPVEIPIEDDENDDDVIFLQSESQPSLTYRPTPIPKPNVVSQPPQPKPTLQSPVVSQSNSQPNPTLQIPVLSRPNLPVLSGLSFNSPRPIQRIQNAKPGSIMNKLSEVATTLQSTQNKKNVEDMILLSKSQLGQKVNTNPPVKSPPTQVLKQNFQLRTPQILNSNTLVSKPQNVGTKTVVRASPAQKMVKISRINPGQNSPQNVVKNIKVDTPQPVPKLQESEANRSLTGNKVVRNVKMSMQQPAQKVQASSQAAKTLVRTLASYRPIPKLDKTIQPSSPELAKRKPQTSLSKSILSNLEKLGIMGKVEGLSREEVLKAVRATSVRDLSDVKNVKTPGKTYVKIKKGGTCVGQNPFSVSQIENVDNNDQNTCSTPRSEDVMSGDIENMLSPFRSEEIATSDTQNTFCTPSEEVTTRTCSSTSQESDQSNEEPTCKEEESALSQIVIQNVYTADDIFFNSSEFEETIVDTAQVESDANEIVYYDGSNVETVPSHPGTPSAKGISPSLIKPKILPQKRSVKIKSPKVLIDPIRGEVIYNKILQKHIKPGERKPINFDDIAETMSAVAAITPDAESNPDGAKKGNVVFLLYPMEEGSENSVSPFQEGQIQQVLALVPSDSKLATAVPVAEIDESKKTDFDLMPPPLLPARKNLKVIRPPTPSNSKLKAIVQRTLQFENNQPHQPEDTVRKSSSKDLKLQNPRRRTTSTKRYVSQPLHEESEIQEILSRLDAARRKNFVPKPASKNAESESFSTTSGNVLQNKSILQQGLNHRPDFPRRRKPKLVPRSCEDLEIEPSAVVTPVDILQIINKGKKPEIKGRCTYHDSPHKSFHFAGFTRREMRPVSCLREIKAIIKKEKTKITRLKKKMAAQDESNIVYCGSATNYFLPENVKTEIEEDDVRHEIEYETFTFDNNKTGHDLEETDILPTISEVVSKVNQEVLHMKQTQPRGQKNVPPPNLSRTEQALELIKKGLEMIQNWSQENGKSLDGTHEVQKTKTVDPVLRGKRDEVEATVSAVEKTRRRRKQPGKNEEEPVKKRRRRKKDEIEKSKPKQGSVGANATKASSGAEVKKRGRKKKVPEESDDDLLVVKRVDIIKHQGPVKRRGRQNKM